MTDRFVDDNWGGIENEETTDKEPTKPQEVTDNS